MSKIKVYLCGSNITGWQETVKSQCSDELFEFFDNTDVMYYDEDYAESVVNNIKNSDIVFAYLGVCEECHKSFWELGYADGLGKNIIRVEDLFNDQIRDLPLLLASSILYNTKLSDGIHRLKELLNKEEIASDNGAGC